jgi:hypothetical protein
MVIEVRVAGSIEYWGTIQWSRWLYFKSWWENNFKPKKQEDTKSVVFCFGYDAIL